MSKYDIDRSGSRVRVCFELAYSSGREDGEGLLVDISYSGARVENVSHPPPVGAGVRLFIMVDPAHPFEIVGDVVRHTDKGFAIVYKISDPRVCALVDDAAAIIAAA